MKRITLLALTVALLLMAAGFVFNSVENSTYYDYRDRAIVACQSGDMDGANADILTAIEHARDPDLISEGLHYKQLLFEKGYCNE